MEAKTMFIAAGVAVVAYGVYILNKTAEKGNKVLDYCLKQIDDEKNRKLADAGKIRQAVYDDDDFIRKEGAIIVN